MSRDRTFLIVLGGLFIFMSLFGAGMVILSIIHEPSDQVTLRVVGALGSMFSSIIGLIVGYLVGKRNGNEGGAK